MKIEDVKVGMKVIAHNKTEGMKPSKINTILIGVPLFVNGTDGGEYLLDVVKNKSGSGYVFNASDFEPYEEPLKDGDKVTNLCNSCKHSRWNCVPNETAWDEKYNITSCSQYVLSEEEQQQQKIKELQEEIKQLQNEIKQLTVEKARYKALWYETNDTLKKCPIIYTKIKEDKNGHQVIACYTSAVELRESEGKGNGLE